MPLGCCFWSCSEITFLNENYALWWKMKLMFSVENGFVLIPQASHGSSSLHSLYYKAFSCLSFLNKLLLPWPAVGLPGCRTRYMISSPARKLGQQRRLETATAFMNQHRDNPEMFWVFKKKKKRRLFRFLALCFRFLVICFLKNMQFCPVNS